MRSALVLALVIWFSSLAVAATPTAVTAEAKAPEVSQDESIIGNHSPAAYPMGVTELREMRRQSPTAEATAVLSAAPARTELEQDLTYALLVFAFLVILVLAGLAIRAPKSWSPDSILRVFGIALILPLAVVLVVAGYSEKQMAPVMGLLGVVAGYLLGHSQKPSGGG